MFSRKTIAVAGLALLGWAVLVLVPAFMPVRTFGTLCYRSASWHCRHLESAIDEAQAAGSPLPTNAAELQAVLAATSAGDFVRTERAEIRDVEDGAVTLEWNSEPNLGRRTIEYRFLRPGGYEVHVVHDGDQPAE